MRRASDTASIPSHPTWKAPPGFGQGQADGSGHKVSQQEFCAAHGIEAQDACYPEPDAHDSPRPNPCSAETYEGLGEALRRWQTRQLDIDAFDARMKLLQSQREEAVEAQHKILARLSPEEREALESARLVHIGGMLYEVRAVDGEGRLILSSVSVLNLGS